MLTCQATCCKHASPTNGCFPPPPFSKKTLRPRYSTMDKLSTVDIWGELGVVRVCKRMVRLSWTFSKRQQDERQSEDVFNFHHHNVKTLFPLFLGGSIFFFESFVKLMKTCHVRSYQTVKSKSANPKNSKGEVSSLPSKKKPRAASTTTSGQSASSMFIILFVLVQCLGRLSCCLLWSATVILLFW